MKKKELLKPEAIVISHSYADFDAIASTIAASKLYPEALPILNYTCEEEVQRFLSIYKDYLRLTPIHQISFEAVKQVIITDFQDISRIKPLMLELKKRPIKIVVFDHHPVEDPVKGVRRVLKPYGSTTTILYERLKRNKIIFSAIEATLFLIGIYEDTGSLSFSSTTVKDLEAAAFFLKKGGKLNVISDFVFPPISDNQKALYTQLFSALHVLEIKGVQIGVCAVEAKKYVEGVSFLAHRILEATDVDILIVIVKFKQDTLIVGRSRDEKILHIHRIMEYYGGGGHKQAGSAFIKEKSLDLNILSINILRKIKKHIRMSRQVKDFMTSPVKVVNAETSAEETLKIMLRYGHSGMPVVDRDRVIGIISRKDIERMNEEKLRLRPVRFYMSRNPVVITPESSLKEAENIMVDRDIGRLPVVFEEKVIGILTRSDLLRALYGIHKNQTRQQRKKGAPPDQNEIKRLMESLILPPRIQSIQQIAKLADDLSFPIYLVGGCVRDLLLGLSATDIDLLIDGDALILAQEYKKRYPSTKVVINTKFRTSKIILSDDLIIDLASARTEYYEHPADLPQVSTGSLREDLFRRDFTINTLAICLNKNKWGLLINYYNGFEDLKNKKIRILHNLSFIEDPSRIFRAIAYLLKFGFIWESKTKELAINAMKSGIFERTSRFRILSEFISLLKEPVPISKAITRLNDIQALPMLSSSINLDRPMLESIRKAEKLSPFVPDDERWIIYLLIISLSVDPQEMNEIMERLKLNKRKKTWILHFRDHYRQTLSALSATKSLKASELFLLLEPYRNEELAVLASLADPQQRKAIERFFFVLKPAQIFSSGEEIISKTGLQGKQLGKVIRQLKLMQLDQGIHNKEEELAMACDLSKGVHDGEI